VKNASDPAADMASELRVVLGKLRRRLREHANKGDLSLSQVAVLGFLDREGPSTVTTLARARDGRARPRRRAAEPLVADGGGASVDRGEPRGARGLACAGDPFALEPGGTGTAWQGGGLAQAHRQLNTGIAPWQ
jgi:hypothetical protein